MKEWSPYKISIPKEGQWGNGFGSRLDEVYHIVHVSTARRILEDGILRAGLIDDKSKLNTSRRSVTWLSANAWQQSIYGNIKFVFSWSDIMRGKNFYWVEAMTDYKPHAYRLLVTDKDLDTYEYVTRYEPGTSKGPLRERNGNWYFNSNYTSEFMFDGDLNLETCKSFNFIDHHKTICRLHKKNECPDQAGLHFMAGARIIAFMLGNDLHPLDKVLKDKANCLPNRLLSTAFDDAISGIWFALAQKPGSFGGTIANQASACAVLRGALALYGADQKDAATALISLIKSSNVFESALEELVNSHFGITGWSIQR